VTELRVLFHAHVCPDCGSDDITEAEVQTGGGITEIALTCTPSGPRRVQDF
jgi:predicted nucleic-acid-binding Zn-ribbon protein